MSKLKEISNEDYCLKDNIGFVSLIDHCGNDLSVVNSARVSFGKRIDVMEEKDEKLIKFLLNHEHGSPLEHNSLTYLVKCPIFVARQWHRHRIGISINEISGRYTEIKEEFYIPLKFREQSKNNRQASIEGELNNQELLEIYKKSVDDSFSAYKKLLEGGVAREQARGVLPLTVYTEYYWTCNLRSLFHFVRLRDHDDAQYEIRQYASAMIRQAKNIFPKTIKIWEDLGRP